MTATIYPRINPTVASDIRTGAALAPLCIRRDVDFQNPPDADVIILATEKNAAASAAVPVTPNVTPPDAPGQVLPFRVQHANSPVHIKIAFFDDPAATVPAFALPADLRVAVIPDEAFSGGSVTLNCTPIEPFHAMLPVNAPLGLAPKNVPSGTATPYAQIEGFGLANNVFSLRVSFTVGPNDVPAAAINANWFLVVKTREADIWATFAVTETPGDDASVAEVPWLHVPSPSPVLELEGPFTPGALAPAGSIANIRNFGTGPLTISASTASDGADELRLAAAGPIAPGGIGSVGLEYLAADGISALHVPLTSNDTAANTAAGAPIGFHEGHIHASATAASIGVADTILVLDASGSMTLRPDGIGNGNPANTDPAARRRWDNLQRAVDHMAFGYVSFLQDAGGGSGTPPSRLGVAVFPDVLNKGTAGWERRAGVLVDSAPVTTPNLVTTITNRLVQAGAAIEGRGLTPIGEGLEVAMGNASGDGMFDPDRAAHRRWLVLMTDGAHNAGDTNPREFIQPDAMPDFVDKEVRVFSIAYATETTGAAVDLLQDLAENALNPVGGAGPGESRFAPAPPTIGFEKGLTDVFLDALATTIGLEPDFDPVGEVTANNPIAIHEFQVSPFDAGVGLFIDWESQDRERLSIALISPRCERFDEAELERNAGFQFRKLPDYAHAYISQQILSGSDGGSARFGTWRLELRLRPPIIIEAAGAARGAAPASEAYKFSIFNRSNLKLEARATSVRNAAGAPIELVARLRSAGIPVRGARIVGTVTAPALDFGTVLANATVKLPEPRLGSAATAAGVPPPDPSEVAGTWAAKAHALAQQFGPVQNSRTDSQIVFEEIRPGVYRAQVTHTPNAGVYSIHVVASGLAGDVSYRRERVLTATLEAVPDAAHTLVTYSLGEHGQLVVHVRPRDLNDRVVIFDPIHADRLGIEICDAKPTSEVTNAFDGSYSRAFKLPGKGRAELVLSWDGVAFLGPLPVPDLDALCWVDTVFAYKPGQLGDDAPFNDPKKALGPVKGPRDPFVSLGGGHIALGVGHDKRSSRKGHFQASHIAVFTDAARLAPYRVLVRRGHKDDWISIGTGLGPVQVFEVPRKLGPLQAILIDDLGRIRPGGVRLQGVGYVAGRPSKPTSPHRPRSAPSATKPGAEQRS